MAAARPSYSHKIKRIHVKIYNNHGSTIPGSTIPPLAFSMPRLPPPPRPRPLRTLSSWPSTTIPISPCVNTASSEAVLWPTREARKYAPEVATRLPPSSLPQRNPLLLPPESPTTTTTTPLDRRPSNGILTPILRWLEYQRKTTHRGSVRSHHHSADDGPVGSQAHATVPVVGSSRTIAAAVLSENVFGSCIAFPFWRSGCGLPCGLYLLRQIFGWRRRRRVGGTAVRGGERFVQ